METLILEGRKMDTMENVHSYLREKFQLGEDYGNNLDALWDMLSARTDELSIVLKDEDYMFNKLGEYSEGLISLFEDLSIECENISFRIDYDF